MKIILIEDLKALGKKGDIKEVADGYAQNFLFPKNLARAATTNALKDLAQKKEKEAMEVAINHKKNAELADRLRKAEIILSKEEKKGKLFGSVTAKNIANELKNQGLEISPEQVIIKQVIKSVGEHELEIKLSASTIVKIKVKVISK